MRRGKLSSRAVPILAAIGLLTTVALGSLWTGAAVVEGSTIGVLVRFVVSLAGGLYYLIMYRVASGKSLAMG